MLLRFITRAYNLNKLMYVVKIEILNVPTYYFQIGIKVYFFEKYVWTLNTY